jgi:hypothetical protein
MKCAAIHVVERAAGYDVQGAEKDQRQVRELPYSDEAVAERCKNGG